MSSIKLFKFLVLFVLIISNVYALCPDLDDYKGYGNFIKGSENIGDISKDIGLRLEKTDSLKLLPDELKNDLDKSFFDITNRQRNIDYFDKNGKVIATIRSTIREEKGYTVINLNDILVNEKYRGGTGTQLFGNFVKNTKAAYGGAPVILQGQAASLKVANYWAYNGAKFGKDIYKTTINNRVIIALETEKGIFKYYDDISKTEKILKDKKGWNLIKAEKPKNIKLPETSKAFWFEF